MESSGWSSAQVTTPCAVSGALSRLPLKFSISTRPLAKCSCPETSDTANVLFSGSSEPCFTPMSSVTSTSEGRVAAAERVILPCTSSLPAAPILCSHVRWAGDNAASSVPSIGTLCAEIAKSGRTG